MNTILKPRANPHGLRVPAHCLGHWGMVRQSICAWLEDTSSKLRKAITADNYICPLRGRRKARNTSVLETVCQTSSLLHRPPLCLFAEVRNHSSECPQYASFICWVSQKTLASSRSLLKEVLQVRFQPNGLGRFPGSLFNGLSSLQTHMVLKCCKGI